eukprot:3186083-Pyramimonas_sp.AAC.1
MMDEVQSSSTLHAGAGVQLQLQLQELELAELLGQLFPRGRREHLIYHLLRHLLDQGGEQLDEDFAVPSGTQHTPTPPHPHTPTSVLRAV